MVPRVARVRPNNSFKADGVPPPLNSSVRRATTPVTKEDFLRRRNMLGRQSPPYDKAAAIVLAVAATSGTPIGFYAPASVGFGYIGLLLFACITYAIYAARWSRRTGLLCYACGLPLLNEAGDVAVATGVCPRCRKAAFEQAPNNSFKRTR